MLQTCTSFSVSVSSFVKLMPSSKVTFRFSGTSTSRWTHPWTAPLFPTLCTPLHSEDLFDVWRCNHSAERDFNFFSPRHNTHIDTFLIDRWILQQVSSSSILDITWSDRAAISIYVEEKEFCKPIYIWRCNRIILTLIPLFQLMPFLCEMPKKHT